MLPVSLARGHISHPAHDARLVRVGATRTVITTVEDLRLLAKQRVPQVRHYEYLLDENCCPHLSFAIYIADTTVCNADVLRLCRLGLLDREYLQGQ